MDDGSERFSLSLNKLQDQQRQGFHRQRSGFLVHLAYDILFVFFNQTEALLVVELYSDGFIVLPELKYNRYLYEILVSKYTVRLFEVTVAL